MDFTALLDVGVGLTVVYLGTSLFVTVANEYLASIRNWRGKRLAADLTKLVTDEVWRRDLAAVPAFRGLFHPVTVGASQRGQKALKSGGSTEGSAEGNRPPAPASYVDSALLAEQLAGLFLLSQSNTPNGDGEKSGLNGRGSTFEKQLNALWLASDKVPGVFVVRLSGWIEKSLTSMGEVYKRKLQTSSFLIGLFLAVSMNLNTVHIAAHLWKDKESRSALAVIGADLAGSLTPEQLSKCSSPAHQNASPAGSVATSAPADSGRGSTESSGKSTTVADGECAMVNGVMRLVAERADASKSLPIGWPPNWNGIEDWFAVPGGWILTAFAVSLGATFWFDLLKRLVNLRHGMTKPE